MIALSPPTEPIGLISTDGGVPPDCTDNKTCTRFWRLPLVTNFIGCPPSDCPKSYDEASLVAQAGSKTVPIWFANSTNEIVGLPQAKAFDDALTKAGVEHHFELLDGGAHADEYRARVWNPAMEWAAGQVGVAPPPPISFSGTQHPVEPGRGGVGRDRARVAHRSAGGGVARRRGGHVTSGSGRAAGGSGQAPGGSGWEAWVDARCATIDEAGRWRSVRSFDAQGPEGTLVADGRHVVSYASNDYLGLTQHPAVKAAAVDAVERWGTGSGAARLVVGSRPVHHDLERELADWRGTEAALLFPTGFAANLSAVTTFGTAGVRILSDELNHASIIDGCRMAHAQTAVYRHADAEHLAAQLDQARADGVARTMIVTDTVFSMDGDLAPLEAIIELARQHGSLLVLDEAHAVLGPSLDGRDGGVDVEGVDVLRVGTLSKTLGSLGGFIAAPRRFVDLMVNAARPFIFTTASSPADAAAGLAAVRIVRSAEGDELRARLRAHIDRLAPGHPSPVIPVVVGDERDAVALSNALLEQGLLVPAIRPPTVPVGTSRLRVALSAAHTPEQIEALAQALALSGQAVR